MKLKNVLKNKFFQLGFILIVVLLSFIIFQKTITKVTLLSSHQTPVPDATETSKVLRIVDGDTIEIENGRKVRYIGINTPEIESGECFATEASEFNKELILGKGIKLIKDTSEVDKYGRLLRYVYIGDDFINDDLVKNGFARVMTVPPDTKFKEEFKNLENYARVNKLGLWGKCINK